MLNAVAEELYNPFIEPSTDHSEVGIDEKDGENNHGCVRCGKCCMCFKRHSAYLTPIDILKIGYKTGLSKEEFVVDFGGDAIIKPVFDEERGGLWCYFHSFDKDGLSTCGLHGFYKPSICKVYPFEDTCLNDRRHNGGIGRMLTKAAYVLEEILFVFA